MSYLRKLEAKATKRDQQLLALRASLAAAQARASSLHSRLISTLDTLDVLQQTRHRETEELELSNKALARRTTKLRQQLDKAIVERDDMREAVELLVEKVERTNDYSLISQSRISQESLIEPMMDALNNSSTNSKMAPLDAQSAFHEQQLDLSQSSNASYSYLPAIVKSLSNDLALERQAHERSKREAATQIAILEAQLANRDAELEAYVVLSSSTDGALKHSTAEEGYQHQIQQVQSPPLAPMTQDEALAILDHTAQRNRRLELEVEGLARKLEQARTAAAMKLSAPPPPVPPVEVSPQGNVLPKQVPTPKPVPLLFSPISQAVLLALDQQIVSLDDDILHLQAERENIVNSSSNKSNSLLGQSQDNGDSTENFENVLLLEEECIRLAASERGAREELRGLQQSSERTEFELRDAIAALESRLDDQRRDMSVIPSTYMSDDNTFTSFGASTPRPQQAPGQQDRQHTPDPFLFHSTTTGPLTIAGTSFNPINPSDTSFSAASSPTPSHHPGPRSFSLSFSRISPPPLSPSRIGRGPQSPTYPFSIPTRQTSVSPHPPPSYRNEPISIHQQLQPRNPVVVEKELQQAREAVREKDELLKRLRADFEALRIRVADGREGESGQGP